MYAHFWQTNNAIHYTIHLLYIDFNLINKVMAVLMMKGNTYFPDVYGESAASLPLLNPRENETEESHAEKIVSEMEQDTALMEDNPTSEHLRM